MASLQPPVVFLLAAALSSACSYTVGGSLASGDAEAVDLGSLGPSLDAGDAGDAVDVPDVADEDAVDVPDVVDRPDTGIPPREDCSTPFDDDGDGLVNEDCPCEPAGRVERCFPADLSLFRGMCRFGQHTCQPSGRWGPCVGAWAPLDLQGRPCERNEAFTDTEVTRLPVDIVWAVDTSGSMSAETAAVNANLNRFAQTIAASGLDYRVVMIARRGTGTRQVCVPPPLGAPGCGNTERFLHVDRSVGSTDALSLLISTHPMWRSVLRPNSARFFVVVTDDESAMTAQNFDRQIRAFGGFDDYVFNSIVGYETRTDCPTMARRGSQYLTLTSLSLGDRARVCDSDWTSIFMTFARSIASRVTSWELAETPRLDTVQVYIITPDGVETRLLSGWSYDPATRRVTLDPDRVPPRGSRVRVVYRPANVSP